MRDLNSARQPITKAVSVAMTAPPARLAGLPRLQEQVQRRRYRHAPQSRRDRQGGHARMTQLAQDQFPLELHGDEEEE